MHFIGEDGYYPDWAKGNGRWVLQKVFTTVQGFIGETDLLAKPSIADEGLIWAPPRGGLQGLTAIFRRSEESLRAIQELQRIALVCSECTWKGFNPRIATRWSSSGPASWIISCPKCGRIAGPDIDDIDWDNIISRWKDMGMPRLEHPACAKLITSTRPIFDLEEWIQSFEPMEKELAYVGQQLWPNFAAFMHSVRESERIG